MRGSREDDHDIVDLIEHGSSSWKGTRPMAFQARWAAEGGGRRPAARLVAAGLCLAALLAGSVALLATPWSPGGAATSVVRLVSYVLMLPHGGAAAPSPPAPLPPSPLPSPSVSPSASVSAPPATPRSTLRPLPTRTDGGTDGRPTPHPSSSPFPSPSRPPDE